MSAYIPEASSWLVATKLHPPLVRADTIRRPQLEEALVRSVQTLALTLVSAPAGYGKTTTLATLPLILPEYPLAWVTLDAEDNDPIRFVGLLISALQNISSACGASAWPLLSGGAAAGNGLKRAMAVLINDILHYLPDPFILVLDDLHFITEPAVFVALEYLLDHQPAQMHLAIGTRYDPPLRLARMAARRQLAELRRADLSFSQSEAFSLLHDTLGLNLTDLEVATLQERIEGWPAGLCLLAGPLERRVNSNDRMQLMTAMSQMERYALDFLAEEVLLDLPADIRRFLLQTSILAEMTPGVCEAVTGRQDAAEVLDGLYRQNLTIASIGTTSDGEPIYRHHALFARLLTRQLEREFSREQIVELHHLAARVQSTPGRKVAHYIAAELWEDAAQVMLQFGMLLLHQGMSETVRSWYGALPEHVRTRYPLLAVIMGRCEIHRGDYPAASVYLNQAREAYIAMQDTEGEGDALTSLITIAYAGDNRPAVAAYVERTLQLPLSSMGQVAARLALAWLNMCSSDWEAGQDNIRQALAVAQATDDRRVDLIGTTYMSALMLAMSGCMEPAERYCAKVRGLALPETPWRLGADELSAWPLLWRGETTAALSRATEAENLRMRLGGYPFLGIDPPALLAILHLANGESAAVAQDVEKLRQRLTGCGRSKLMFYLHTAGRTLALLGRYTEAAEMLQQLIMLPNDPLTRYLGDYLAGLLALLEGRSSDAGEALASAVVLERAVPIAWVGGSARLLQAGLHWGQGNTEEAHAEVNALLAEWAEAGCIGRALLDGPVGLWLYRHAAEQGSQPARQVLQMFSPALVRQAAAGVGWWHAQGAAAGVAQGGAAGGGAAAAQVVRTGAAAISVPAACADLVEPLTQRECDVLKLLVAGYTNRQIADELYISMETVKSHVARILRKLEVESRTQAAIRGREMGF